MTGSVADPENPAGQQQKFVAGKMEMKQLQEAEYMNDVIA
jgi:t-SNARE complex subunit (syntaxin)